MVQMMYEKLVKELRELSHEFYLDDNNKYAEEKLKEAADAIEELICMVADEHNARLDAEERQRWIPVTEALPECDLGAEVGNIEWISCGMVHAGCFGRGGKYRDAYFRTWTDAGEGMDAKDADYWRAVTLPEPPNEK